jgi:hypothetical protein
MAGPYPAVCPDGGARVRIFVADTGLVSGATATFPWLAGVQGDTDPRSTRDGVILPYGGHGTFVAGVPRCMAPDAQVYVIVTGLIAARMASRGESGREAAVALLAEARTRTIPGVGPALLPRCGN